MRKYLLPVLSAVFLVSCCGRGSETETYHEWCSITGIVDSVYYGATAYLYIGDQVDSTDIFGDSSVEGTVSFGMEIPADTTEIGMLVIVGRYGDMVSGEIVIEPGSLVVRASGYDLDRYGTQLNERLEWYCAARDSILANNAGTFPGGTSSLYRSQMHSLNARFFNENKDNILGTLPMLSMAHDREVFDSMYLYAGDLVRQHPDVVSERLCFENRDMTSEGMMFKDFTLPDGSEDGTPVSLSDYLGKGRYVLVDFRQRADMLRPPYSEDGGVSLPDLYEMLNEGLPEEDRYFEVVGVLMSRRDIPEEISWPLIYDTEDKVSSLYGIPDGGHEAVLFAPDGTILMRGIYDNDDLMDMVVALLPEDF